MYIVYMYICICIYDMDVRYVESEEHVPRRAFLHAFRSYRPITQLVNSLCSFDKYAPEHFFLLDSCVPGLR